MIEEKNRLPIVPTKEWNDLFWGYNLPLQMWDNENGWHVLNYMPRRENCQFLESFVTKEELPQFCQNTALILRNLAELFEALGRGEIKHIYYPDKLLSEAIRESGQKKCKLHREDANDTAD